MADKILEVKNLDLTFSTTAGPVHAIRGVNIDLERGETVAVVGESGSGKSVVMKTVMGILAGNARINSGEIIFRYNDDKGAAQEVDILKKEKKWIRKNINGRRISMIFQDPMTSLDPTMTIGKQLMEGMIMHLGISRMEAAQRAVKLLDEVGLTEPGKRMKQYPHQLSGGTRQRVVIAIAISCNPDLLICDEPTTALDVTIQARILELIKRLQVEHGISVIYITHDLGVVANVAERVAVLYAGQIVELGTVEDIFYDPRHPYTWALLSSLPQLTEKDTDLFSIPGTPPSLYNKITGDAFAPRNLYCMKIDTLQEPPMFQISDTHFAKTWLLDPRSPKIEKPEILEDIQSKIKRSFHIEEMV